jgi:hypothetical protein
MDVLMFIVTEVYLDSNTNSVVAEAFVVESTEEVFYDPRFLPILVHVTKHEVSIDVDTDVYMCWRRALPAMAERCRDWEHTATCEFKNGVPASVEPPTLLCSCGHGKMEAKDVCKVWPYAPDFVTRVAISPLFASPYLEAAKGGPLSRNAGKTKLKPIQLAGTASEVSVEAFKCRDCGKDGAKKCGGCGEVYYCSRPGQRRDWKKHKASCQRHKGDKRLRNQQSYVLQY